MKDIKFTPSITPRDSECIKAYLHDIDQYQLLSADEEVELAHRIHQGDKEALERMVNSNLRFVVSVAKQYPECKSLSLSDLINEGNIGLIKAAERFDETRGFKFCSFAIHWIRQSILQAISEHGTMIRIPSNKQNELHHIHQFMSAYYLQYQCYPAAEEIAEALDLPVQRVRRLISINSKTQSFTTPLKEGEESTLLDVTPDESLHPTDHTVDMESLRTDLRVVMKTLSDRAQHIIRLFFGIDCQEHSINEISEMVGLSRERCRQIRERALKQLAVDRLREYL